jgi:hypothetical protein
MPEQERNSSCWRARTRKGGGATRLFQQLFRNRTQKGWNKAV